MSTEMGITGTRLTVKTLAAFLSQLEQEGYGDCQVVANEESEVTLTVERVKPMIRIVEPEESDNMLFDIQEKELAEEILRCIHCDENLEVTTKSVVVLV